MATPLAPSLKFHGPSDWKIPGAKEPLCKKGEGMDQPGALNKNPSQKKQWPAWVKPVTLAVGSVALLALAYQVQSSIRGGTTDTEAKDWDQRELSLYHYALRDVRGNLEWWKGNNLKLITQSVNDNIEHEAWRIRRGVFHLLGEMLPNANQEVLDLSINALKRANTWAWDVDTLRGRERQGVFLHAFKLLNSSIKENLSEKMCKEIGEVVSETIRVQFPKASGMIDVESYMLWIPRLYIRIIDEEVRACPPSNAALKTLSNTILENINSPNEQARSNAEKLKSEYSYL